MTARTYSNRQNAVRAAKREHPDGRYSIIDTGKGWAFEPKPEPSRALAANGLDTLAIAEPAFDPEAVAAEILENHGGDHDSAIANVERLRQAAEMDGNGAAHEGYVEALSLIEQAREEGWTPTRAEQASAADDSVEIELRLPAERADALMNRLAERLAPDDAARFKAPGDPWNRDEPFTEPLARIMDTSTWTETRGTIARQPDSTLRAENEDGTSFALAMPAERADALLDSLSESLAPTDAEIIKAARDQARFEKPNHPQVAWLLTEMAQRLERAGTAGAEVAKPARRPKANGAPRPSKAPQDPTQKPVIASPTNQNVARLVDRIEAARGKPEELARFAFKPANTYYATAHRYLLALRAEAEGAR